MAGPESLAAFIISVIEWLGFMASPESLAAFIVSVIEWLGVMADLTPDASVHSGP